MLKILELLDREAPSGNAIFLFEVKTGKVLGGNLEANDLFATKHNVFDMHKIFGTSISMKDIVQTVQPRLETNEVTTIEDVHAVDKDREVHQCTLDFTYLTEAKEGILMIVKIKEDLRPIFLELLLANSKRPAFLLDYTDGLVIKNANEKFYNSFVCTRETIGTKYGNKLENLLSEEDRPSYITDITAALGEGFSAICNIPFRTARGDTLLFYYSKNVIKPLIDEDEKCVFCLLVGLDETIEVVEYPFKD